MVAILSTRDGTWESLLTSYPPCEAEMYQSEAADGIECICAVTPLRVRGDDWQLCGFPCRDAAGDLTDALESAALQEACGDG